LYISHGFNKPGLWPLTFCAQGHARLSSKQNPNGSLPRRDITRLCCPGALRIAIKLKTAWRPIASVDRKQKDAARLKPGSVICNKTDYIQAEKTQLLSRLNAGSPKSPKSPQVSCLEKASILFRSSAV